MSLMPASLHHMLGPLHRMLATLHHLLATLRQMLHTQHQVFTRLQTRPLAAVQKCHSIQGQ